MKNFKSFWKIQITICLCFLLSTPVNAQSISFETGLFKSKVNIADSKVSGMSNAFSSGAGLMVDIPFSRTSIFGVKGGFQYNQLNFSYFATKPQVKEYRFSEENLVIPLMLTLNLKFADNEKQWISFGVGVLASVNMKQEGYSISDNNSFHSFTVTPGERIQAGYVGECTLHTMLSNKLGAQLGVGFHGTFESEMKLNDGVLNVPQSSIGFKMGLFRKF